MRYYFTFLPGQSLSQAPRRTQGRFVTVTAPVKIKQAISQEATGEEEKKKRDIRVQSQPRVREEPY